MDIVVKNLEKVYKQAKRHRGFLGAFRNLVTQQYTLVPAVKDISFTIRRGEAVGYLGPNGAGKSTMIKMLTGILVPTSGEIRISEYIPHRDRVKLARRIGVVYGQRSQLWWDLPVADSFDLHRHIYKIPYEQYLKNLKFCTELLEMGTFMYSPVRQLSLGQRMRAELSLALIHDPDILFLDEPTIGLDVTAKDRIREFLRVINRERGVTIILTSHDLKDIEEVCRRIMIVRDGKSMYDGTVKELKMGYGTKRLVKVEFENDPGQIELEGASLWIDNGRVKTLSFELDFSKTLELLAIIAAKHPIVDVTIEESDIEDVIRKMYQNFNDLNAHGKCKDDKLLQVQQA